MTEVALNSRKDITNSKEKKKDIANSKTQHAHTTTFKWTPEPSKQSGTGKNFFMVIRKSPTFSRT